MAGSVNPWRISGLLMLLAMVVLALLFKAELRKALSPYVPTSVAQKMRGNTISERVDQYGPVARSRLRPYFTGVGMSYPPAEIVLVGLKAERSLEIWGRDSNGSFVLIRTFPILGLSGGPGPKLVEGDEQVPEGIYRVESLNPNSSFHLAMKLDFPNPIDLKHAKRDGRETGGDIMIHGDAVSIGCLAIGNDGIEDLFVLAADVGLPHIKVVLSPFDFRVSGEGNAPTVAAEWVSALYSEIRTELSALKHR